MESGEEPDASASTGAGLLENEHTTVFSDRSSVIHPLLSGYFSKNLFSDLTVLAPDGRRLPCHQIVLSSGSKRFAKLLEQGIPQDDPVLPVWGVDSDALEAVLRCFYTGECHLNIINVVAVMDAAQRLEVTGLAAFCEQFVKEVLQPSTCLQLLAQAMHFKIEELAQHVLQFSESCFVEVTSHEEFLRAELPLVTKMLAYHQTHTDSSLVLRAGWEWLVAEKAHNTHVADIAALLPLPEDIGEDDLLNKANADRYGVLWRQPEILPPPPPPEPIKQEPSIQASLESLLQAGSLPQLQMLQQAGLLPHLPKHLLSEGGDAARASGLINGIITPTAGNGGWSSTLASELLAQLGSVAGGYGALGSLGTGSDLVTQLGEMQRSKRGARATQGDDEDEAPGSFSTGPPSSARARTGNNRGAGARGVCQVEGCHTDLGGLRDYHQRYKICEFHLKISNVLKDGIHQRFCQQCGRFQCITEFEGNKRSCKARLQRHNDRRRKRLEEEPPGSYYGGGNHNVKRVRDDDSDGNRGSGGAGARGGTAWAEGLGGGLANLLALPGMQGL